MAFPPRASNEALHCTVLNWFEALARGIHVTSVAVEERRAGGFSPSSKGCWKIETFVGNSIGLRYICSVGRIWFRVRKAPG